MNPLANAPACLPACPLLPVRLTRSMRALMLPPRGLAARRANAVAVMENGSLAWARRQWLAKRDGAIGQVRGPPRTKPSSRFLFRVQSEHPVCLGGAGGGEVTSCAPQPSGDGQVRDQGSKELLHLDGAGLKKALLRLCRCLRKLLCRQVPASLSRSRLPGAQQRWLGRAGGSRAGISSSSPL